MPLGAFKIASVLRKNGYSTLVVNHLSTFDTEELKEIIDASISSSTIAVGFSTTFFRKVVENMDNPEYVFIGKDTVFPQGREFEDVILSYIKEKNPAIKVLAGGANVVPDCDNTNLDYLFMGYSETSIIDLMNHLTTGSVLPNSSVNDYGITVVDDRMAKNYKFVEDKMIWQKTDIVNHKVLPIEIGRGCIFKCKFCSFPLNGKKSLEYIKYPDVLYQELLSNYLEFGIEHYLIVDDTFNDHMDKLRSIADVVKRLPFQPKFWCYARLDLLCSNEGMIDILHEIGVRGFYFGIETLDRSAGAIVGKGYDRKKQMEMVRYVRDKYPDMSMHGSFIMGLPKESLDSMKETCAALENGDIPLHSWMMKGLFIFPTRTVSFLSELDNNYEKYGYTIEDMGPYGIGMWKNEHTSFLEVHDMTTECIDRSRQLDHFYVPAHDSFEMVNFGYDLESTISMPFKDFRWDEVLKQKVPEFISEYKKNLKELIARAIN